MAVWKQRDLSGEAGFEQQPELKYLTSGEFAALRQLWVSDVYSDSRSG